jgi:hypothetical protein
VLELARVSTEQGTRGIPLDGLLAEQRWRTPLITTAYAHIEAFVAARLSEAERGALMRAVPAIFAGRWLPALRREAAQLRHAMPGLLGPLADADPTTTQWLAQKLTDAVRAVETILPDEDFTMTHLEIAAAAGEAGRRRLAA